MAPRSPRKQKAPKSNVVPEIDPNSSFTPESFERELKNLASKAQEETWAHHLAEQASVYLKSITVLALMAIFSNASQLALSPVYGSIPSGVWHSKLVAAACFAGWSSNLFLNRNLPFRPHLLLPVIAIYIPAAQFFLYKASGLLGASWGPLATEALTLFPLTALFRSLCSYVSGHGRLLRPYPSGWEMPPRAWDRTGSIKAWNIYPGASSGRMPAGHS